jgi:hypothetical protein
MAPDEKPSTVRFAVPQLSQYERIILLTPPSDKSGKIGQFSSHGLGYLLLNSSLQLPFKGKWFVR